MVDEHGAIDCCLGMALDSLIGWPNRLSYVCVLLLYIFCGSEEYKDIFCELTKVHLK